MTVFLDAIKHKGPRFFMLIGLPGSGKSTFRKATMGKNGAVLSTDDYLEDVAAERGVTYDAIWGDTIKEATSSMNAAFDRYVKSRSDIVLDRTNLSAKKRKGFLARLPKDYFKMAIVFERPDDVEWKRRIESRPGNTIPWGILYNMEANFVRPTPAEGWDLITEVPQ